MTKNASGHGRKTLQLDAHQNWCDPQAHTRAIAESHPDEGHAECVGHDFDIPVDVPVHNGRDQLYGVWMHHPGDADPVFYLEWGFTHAELSIDRLKMLQDLLRHLGPGGLSSLSGALGQAVGDFEGSRPRR